MPTISRKLNIISRCGGLYRAKELSDGELAPFHHGFIFAICRSPGLSQEALSRILCYNKSTVARRLAFLEDHGYITRIPSEQDKRILQVYPTDKMLDVLPRIREIARTWNDAVSADIPEADLQVFERVLDLIAVRAKELAGIADEEVDA